MGITCPCLTDRAWTKAEAAIAQAVAKDAHRHQPKVCRSESGYSGSRSHCRTRSITPGVYSVRIAFGGYFASSFVAPHLIKGSADQDLSPKVELLPPTDDW